MTARLIMPTHAKAGQVVDVKLSILHPMETGMRRNQSAELVSRNVIETCVATFEDTVVFEARWGTGISANPYFAFSFVPPRSGSLKMAWHDTSGAHDEVRAAITIT